MERGLSERTTDSIRIFSRTLEHRERLKEYLCSYCLKAGVPIKDCYVSESELGGVNESTGEIICKYCLNLIKKMGTIR